jgi:dTDP-4-amino-4,6-dideoxygalactose transaminase
MDQVAALARAHRLAVVEDAAQAVGATWQGRPVGTWGDAACLSFYPTKNLGACGDAGMVLTDRDDVAERVRRLRHHGDGGRYRHVELGYASRLDEIQAALLRVKLSRLAAWTEDRRRLAARYRARLGSSAVGLPGERAEARHVYHLFTIRHARRDALATALADLGVGTAVHYPIPVPAQPMFGMADERRWPEAWRAAREVLSLPCFAELRDDEVDTVAAAVLRAGKDL